MYVMFFPGVDTETSENVAICVFQDPAVPMHAEEAAATALMTADKTRIKWKGKIIFPSGLVNTISTLSSIPSQLDCILTQI